MKILIMGLPGSGKTTLAEPLAKELNGIWLNADKIREEYNDWDFTPEGRIRQALRMKYLSDGIVKAGKIAIADFVCPTTAARTEFSANYTVWMDTIKEGRFDDTNKMFEPPAHFNYRVTEWAGQTHLTIANLIEEFLQNKDLLSGQ